MLDLDFRGAQQLLDNFFEPKTTLATEFLTHFKRYNAHTFINSRQGILKESEQAGQNQLLLNFFKGQIRLSLLIVAWQLVGFYSPRPLKLSHSSHHRSKKKVKQ